MLLRTVISATVILLCSVVSFGQKTQFSAEEKAIMKVIEDESKHFWGRDIKSWKKCYVHKPKKDDPTQTLQGSGQCCAF